MTANAQPEDRRRCLDAGMDDYVSKPIDPEDLAGALERWSERRHTEPADAGVPPDRASQSPRDDPLEQWPRLAGLGDPELLGSAGMIGADCLGDLLRKVEEHLRSGEARAAAAMMGA